MKLISGIINKRLKGFSLMEVIAVITIMSILVYFGGSSISTAVSNSKLDQTELIIRNSVKDIELYVLECGKLDVEGAETLSEMAERFIKEFNSNYSSIVFDTESLDYGSKYLTVRAANKKDAYGTNVLLYYSWVNDLYIVASAGPNTVFDFLDATSADTVDDILAVVVGK